MLEISRAEQGASSAGDVADPAGTLRTQIVVSKYLFPLKGPPGLLGEVADSRTGAGKAQDEPGTSRGARVRSCFKSGGEAHRSQLGCRTC